MAFLGFFTSSGRLTNPNGYGVDGLLKTSGAGCFVGSKIAGSIFAGVGLFFVLGTSDFLGFLSAINQKKKNPNAGQRRHKTKGLFFNHLSTQHIEHFVRSKA